MYLVGNAACSRFSNFSSWLKRWRWRRGNVAIVTLLRHLERCTGLPAGGCRKFQSTSLAMKNKQNTSGCRFSKIPKWKYKNHAKYQSIEHRQNIKISRILLIFWKFPKFGAKDFRIFWKFGAMRAMRCDAMRCPYKIQKDEWNGRGKPRTGLQ